MTLPTNYLLTGLDKAKEVSVFGKQLNRYNHIDLLAISGHSLAECDRLKEKCTELEIEIASIKRLQHEEAKLKNLPKSTTPIMFLVGCMVALLAFGFYFGVK